MMPTTWRRLHSRSPSHATPFDFARAGAVLAGTIGGIIGLIIGLHVYAATAWAAVFELGIPAAIAGGAVGLIIGGAVMMYRTALHRHH